jgi:hypothetical protein
MAALVEWKAMRMPALLHWTRKPGTSLGLQEAAQMAIDATLTRLTDEAKTTALSGTQWRLSSALLHRAAQR